MLISTTLPYANVYKWNASLLWPFLKFFLLKVLKYVLQVTTSQTDNYFCQMTIIFICLELRLMYSSIVLSFVGQNISWDFSRLLSEAIL